MRIRYRLATLLTALLGLFAVLGVTVPGWLQGVWNEDAPPIEAPVVQPSVESHVSLMNGPAVEKTHAGAREEDAEISGERAGELRKRLPLATPTQRGCTTKLVGNYSSRGGVAPSMFVLHYTVSANRVGYSDMDAIWSWFNQSRSQASSNYIIDFEGHCYLIVSEASKAWTQGSFNPASISIEFIATGNEPTSAWTNAALRKGARVVADALKRWRIPLRWTNPADCVVVAGITDHNNLECGNNHHDVQPNFPYAKFMRFVREAAAPPEPCYRYRVVDGTVLASSAKFKASEGAGAKLAAFLDLRNSLLRDRLWKGEDNRVALTRVKVAC